jgi:hypothetical protein
MPFNTKQKHITISTSMDIDVYTSGNPSILLDESRSLIGGGWIEIVRVATVELEHLFLDTNALDDSVLVVDEDGLNKNLHINHIATYLTRLHIVGNVILTKDVNGELVGYNEKECEQIKDFLNSVTPAIKELIKYK